ncbi:dTDP-4-amino-4,6-dideoxygalactose transaminase [Leptolyngbya valderiana BDU 20041]|nr:dTDP-4-amino-4,6-dideoxygalactose transaminase [Leptolyngbya valderiana BDU 20041]
MEKIPFNRPYMTGKEITNIHLAHQLERLAGDGEFTQKCHDWLQKYSGCKKALLTHSCTAALEMCALLADIQPGDEVIMPSYTFVSTANAFVLRGGVPVFVDIREDTLNLDESLVEAAISSRTKAIVAVHYAGVACEMDKLKALSKQYGLLLIEDAAQALMSTYRKCPLGGIGDLAAFSFHETKNVISGEGGALFVNNPSLVDRAEIIRDKGTNRSQFFRGEVDKYTWVDIGSSYLPGEIIAAFLYAQLVQAKEITQSRLAAWNIYHQGLHKYEELKILRRPIIPEHCCHNAHMYYVIARSENERNFIIDFLKSHEINSVFHYVPLHSSPAGRKYGRVSGKMSVTDSISSRLVRLPLWVGLDPNDVLETLEKWLETETLKTGF